MEATDVGAVKITCDEGELEIRLDRFRVVVTTNDEGELVPVVDMPEPSEVRPAPGADAKEGGKPA